MLDLRYIVLLILDPLSLYICETLHRGCQDSVRHVLHCLCRRSTQYHQYRRHSGRNHKIVATKSVAYKFVYLHELFIISIVQV